MTRARQIRLGAFLALALAVSASLAQANGLALQSGGRLWLEGKSTIHEYRSTAAEFTLQFQQDETLWPSGVNGAGAVEQFIRARGVSAMDLVVPVTGLHSGKNGLDKNLYKAMHAAEHPEIRFHMTGYEVHAGTAAGELAIDAAGTLRVSGVEREVRLPLTAVHEGGALRMRGSVPVLMSQYGITPPTLMMGALKTADQVVVSFDLLIGAREDTTPAPGTH